MNGERLIQRAIDRHSLISFDIFDTLVKRDTVRPTDVFRIVEERYAACRGAGGEGFAQARMEAESTARQRSGAEEVSLDEIYSVLRERCPDADAFKRLEMEAEYDSCTPNLNVKPWYEYCVRSGKRVVFTSDMYLPRTAIEGILQKCGYARYDALYLSSDRMLTKRSGGLFRAMLAETGARPAQVLHFGDSRRGDVLAALRCGIHPLYVRRKQTNTSFLTRREIDASRSGLLPFLNNRLPLYADEPEAFRWGYEALGPLIAGFCGWVSENVKEERIEELFFLARDMNLVLRAYRRLRGAGKTHYLEVSRRSLRKEFIRRRGSFAAIDETMGHEGMTVREALAVIGMDAAAAGEEVGAAADARLSTLTAEQQKTLDRLVLRELEKDSGCAAEYLTQEGVFSAGKSAIVDIGWHGTIQSMMETVCGREFLGLYFGSTRWPENTGLNARGYWFDELSEDAVREQMAIIYILEVMLFPDVGTTNAYIKTGDGRYVPVYDAFCTPGFEMIGDFQRGAEQMIADLAQTRMSLAHIPAAEAAAAYEALAFRPTRRQARAFSGLEYENDKVFSVADSRGWPHYLLHPRHLAADYREARWKEGFLRQSLPWIRNPHFWVCLIKKRKHFR